MVRQAGAIAVRVVDGEARVLLVRARRNPDHWIFPKGHIEPGESAEDAAVRELAEEGGAAGTVTASAGALEFEAGPGPVRVEYFIVDAHSDVRPAENRERRWCTLAEGVRLLTFPNAKRLLLDAAPRIHQ